MARRIRGARIVLCCYLELLVMVLVGDLKGLMLLFCGCGGCRVETLDFDFLVAFR